MIKVTYNSGQSRINMQRYARALEKEVKAAIVGSAEALREEMITSIQKGVKTGKLYKRGSITHRASAPGQAPASDTGTLANRSIDVRYERGGRSAFVGVNKGGGLEYAMHLEFGTVNMAPRPFVKPASKKLAKPIRKALADAVRKAGKRAEV